MENRKYFKYKIEELELEFERATGNFAVLEDLEEELSHRSTKRARKLLKSIQQSLNSGSPASAVSVSAESPIKPVENQSQQVQDDSIIDWDEAFSGDEFNPVYTDETLEVKALDNRPIDILDTWTVLEALSPQSYKKPDDLVIGAGSVAYFREGQEPWLKGEKSRPKNNLYYLVYLGAIDLEKATTQLLNIYQDKRVERPQNKGLAAMGVVMLDKKGIPVPETGLALSSFSWSYARALQGKLNELKSWEVAEEKLKDGLDKIIYKQDEGGSVLPFSLDKAQQAYHWLVRNCEIPEQDSVAPSFAIRLYQPFSKGEPEPPLLNSFYLDDLQRAKHAAQTGNCGTALSQYLGVIKPSHEYDVLKDKNHIEKVLQPKNMPASRWPSNGRHSLVLLQQTAVNLAMQELDDGGLFSVNGPPGTGKTTLLRDVVASVLVERVKALYSFKESDDAFEHAGQMKLGNGFVHLYKLHESLRGHEILVASSNNKAVENISKELPLKAQIADDIGELNYFSTVSNALSKDNGETWGLIAAVLGNSKNRSQFTNTTWWDSDSGLRNYFLSITGQVNYEVDDDGQDIIPKVIQDCNPPESLQDAKYKWEQARNEFDKALKASENAISLAQKAYELTKRAAALRLESKRNISKQVDLVAQKDVLQKNADTLSEMYVHLSSLLAAASENKKQSLKLKPGFFKRLFARDKWKAWKSSHVVTVSKLKQLTKEDGALCIKLQEVRKEALDAEKVLSELKAEEQCLAESRAKVLASLEKLSPICDGKLVTSVLWDQNHEYQQKFSPNFTDEVQRLRDDVFVASIRLHKAFIDASAKQMRQNLGAFFACLGGKALPSDKQALLPHLWASAFLLTPVISTAFASVGRMLKTMPKESIGWLLIDEAGQATPQAAIGAIYRAKRVMSVGDPLQIEPVVTLSPPLVEGISKHMGVEPYQWMAPDASVQTLSDKANSYGTVIPRDLSEIRIGTPLLVHRRCEDPMFSISNKLAYNGLMVQATVSTASEITALFGVQSAWFDIRGSAQEKWSPEEGEHVCDMLMKACAHFSDDPDIFVVTPFKNVANRMRQRMRMEAARLEQCGIENPQSWINNNIGTVHTFQGKEARAVILLLGAPSSTQTGARNWATSNVNLLNVAVSRAKQNFYVVGNKELWGDIGHMKLISRNLK